MRDKKFFKPSVIKQWVIVVYESERRFPRRAAEEMAFGFCQGAVSVGMQVMDSHPVIVYENGQGVIGEGRQGVLGSEKSPPNLMVVVLPEGGNQIYTAVKHFGESLPLSALKSNKCSRAKPQYWANVMLKLNVKLGGINSVLGEMNAALNDPGHPTIVMGADVNHPAPGADGRPSFAALVSSVDSTTAKYISESRVQMGRVEMIEDLENMCKAAIGKMFPQNPGDADKTGNCQAGTTIDEGLGHPTEFDYYQLTHGGLLGTSRPAHYSVIYDENKFSADAMQSLSFALCHVYARATRSVSIPAPVYYADIVCARAKNHYTPGTDLDLSETATQVSHAEGQLQAFRAGYKPLHANMANLIFLFPES
ncbi:ribonuclease H-like domain-containing protein [Gymnopilus junonius]|uniref:Ribonuclease H-like domain-containing protein n=1 Tax=Gymnopilus junonius TaxID=109634 RepID=A0A9P5NH17_GYMJU|nr:ribonuclease H-like domain-containing protein [Gymnopilus junonius]